MSVTKKEKIARSMPEELSWLSDTIDDLITLANDLRTQYAAHIADTDSHTAADTTNVLTASAVTTIE